MIPEELIIIICILVGIVFEIITRKISNYKHRSKENIDRQERIDKFNKLIKTYEDTHRDV